MKQYWSLEPDLAYLNHGSFGACPRAVLEIQSELRGELERQPVAFLARRLEGLFDDARRELGTFIGADAANLVKVNNATSGVNAVLRSLTFVPGDELLTTNHTYNACRNTLEYVAARAGARVIVAPVPFPLKSPQEVVDAVLGAVTPRTRLALLDHVTSPTGLVFPIAELVKKLSEADIDTLVDGAHAPGMVPLNLEDLGAAYYTGNCHKWICAPKASAFLYVRSDRQEDLVPLTISHGANQPRPGRSRFHDLFDWAGTTDPTPFLCVPKALGFLASLVPGGWAEVMECNRSLVLRGRRLLCEALGVEPPCPEEMVGSLAAVPLPDALGEAPAGGALYASPLQDSLLQDYRIEVPVVPWPGHPKRLIRISAQLYNEEGEYRWLAAALEATVRDA